VRLSERDAARLQAQQVGRFDVVCAPCGGGECVAQRCDEAPRHTDVGARLAIRNMQPLDARAFEVAAVQREMLPWKAAWMVSRRSRGL
jgi:hypothetical protein